jgi:hypothetical protein
MADLNMEEDMVTTAMDTDRATAMATDMVMADLILDADVCFN